MFIAIQLIAGLFASTDPTYATLPDACDQLEADGDSRYCRPHGEGAPVWDDAVCCADDECYRQTPDGCGLFETSYYCEFGERTSDGRVECYFEVPNYCDVFDCPSPAEVPGYQEPEQVQAELLCCIWGICTPYNEDIDDCPHGDIVQCIAPFTNEDGTVGCSDWD